MEFINSHVFTSYNNKVQYLGQRLTTSDRLLPWQLNYAVEHDLVTYGEVKQHTGTFKEYIAEYLITHYGAPETLSLSNKEETLEIMDRLDIFDPLEEYNILVQGYEILCEVDLECPIWDMHR